MSKRRRRTKPKPVAAANLVRSNGAQRARVTGNQDPTLIVGSSGDQAHALSEPVCHCRACALSARRRRSGRDPAAAPPISSTSGRSRARSSCATAMRPRRSSRLARTSSRRRPRLTAALRASSWSSTRFSCRRRSSPEYDPYRTFTQENVFNAETEKILPLTVLMKQGTTLDQLGQILALQPIKVEVHHAGDVSLETFRTNRARLSRREGSFRHRQLSPQGYRPAARRPHLAARRLRCQGGSLPHPRRRPLQVPAGVGEGRPSCSPR